jgi:uncharacterized protein YyaL (SSP411 family)
VEEGITEVVVAGDRGDLLEAVRRRYEPTAVVLWGERSSSALWEGRADGFAYVCRNRVCAMPAGDVDALVARLEQQRAASAPGVELGFLDGR